MTSTIHGASTIRGIAHTEAQIGKFYARLPSTRGAAGALLIDRDGRILLVERTYDAVWPWGPPKTAGNMYLFTGRIPDPAGIRLDPTELSAWAWVAPTEIPHLLAAPTARRVGAALAAHHAQRTVYLEDGYHPLPYRS
ncbi:MAG: hypothetical protein LC808_11015 [Actinobacteria bacterium]|nr:hypothetical protein [Actinomycetota bacterium]